MIIVHKNIDNSLYEVANVRFFTVFDLLWHVARSRGESKDDVY